MRIKFDVLRDEQNGKYRDRRGDGRRSKAERDLNTKIHTAKVPFRQGPRKRPSPFNGRLRQASDDREAHREDRRDTQRPTTSKYFWDRGAFDDAVSLAHRSHVLKRQTCWPPGRYVSLLFPMDQPESGAEVWRKSVVEFRTSWRFHC